MEELHKNVVPLSKYAGFSYLDMLHLKLSSNTLFMAIYHCVHDMLVIINIISLFARSCQANLLCSKVISD